MVHSLMKNYAKCQVLKTKDYIHVEQARPSDNINIKPGAKLMKADF